MTWYSDAAIAGRRLINCHHLEEVFGILGQATLLSNLFAPSSHLPNFVKRHGAVHQVVTLKSFDQLSMRLTMVWEKNVWVACHELLTKFCVVVTWNLRDLGRILFHLGSTAAKWSCI